MLLEVLPKILDFRTSYFNSVRELMNIIQELKPLRYKDSVPKLLSYRLAYIPMSEARGFTLAFGKIRKQNKLEKNNSFLQ